MNVEVLQDNITRVRESLLATIEELPDEALHEPGATPDGWTPADVLAVIAAWESEIVTGLAEIQRRKKPNKLLRAVKQYDSYIEARRAENVDRSLDAIFNDLQGARIQLEVRLEDLTDRDLKNPREFRWLKGKPLWPFLSRNTYERESRFIPGLRAFADRWLDAHSAESDAAPAE